MEYKSNDYILFVFQLANFQSRSMIVPAKEFIEVRKDWYDLLKKYSKEHIFQIYGMEYKVDNLLFQRYSGGDGKYKQDQHDYSEMCNILEVYADGLDHDNYFDIIDKKWYDKSKRHLCEGFNHIKNYLNLKKRTTFRRLKNVNIIDSFLVLELKNNRLKIPEHETNEDFCNCY